MKVADPTLAPSVSSSSAPTRSRRRTVVAAVAVAAALGLSACASDPGPSRVARDIIQAESFRNPELDEECLLTQLDRFSDDELRAINDDLASSDEQRNQEGQAAIDAYILLLQGCL